MRNWLYRFFRWWVLVIGRTWFHFKAVHPEYVPAKGPVLVVANHTSMMDPPVLGAAARHRHDMYYMARATLFTFPIKYYLKGIHAFPIRTKGDWREGASEALENLEKGRAIGVFPEGTRSRDGLLQKGKPGIGWLAYRARVPVVPAHIQGTYEALPRQGGMLKSSRIKVVFGPPLDLSKEYQSPEGRDTYQRIADLMMEGIRRAGEGEAEKIGTS